MSLEQSLASKRASALARLDYPSFGLRDALEHISGLDDAITAHIDALNAQFDAARLVLVASLEGSLIAQQLRDLNDPLSAVGYRIHDSAVGNGLRFVTDQVNRRLAERLDKLRETADSITADPAFPLANTIGRLIQYDSLFDGLTSLARSVSEPSVAIQRTMDEAAAQAARLVAPFDDLQAFARSILGPGEALTHVVDRLTMPAADGSLSSDDDDVAVTGEPEACAGDVAEVPTPVDTLLARAVVDADDAHVAEPLDQSGHVRLALEVVAAVVSLHLDLGALARREGLLAADGSFVMADVTDWLIATCPASARQIDVAARALAGQIEALYSPRGLTRSGSESLSREQLEWILDAAKLAQQFLRCTQSRG